MKLKACLFALVFILPVNAISQDTIVRKNIISMAFPTLLDKTLSLSYYRQINNNMDFVINPRYRAMVFEPLLYWGTMYGNDNHFLRSRALIRSGVQFHKKTFFFEPLVQVDVGWARDLWDTESDNEYYYLRDVDYTSFGMLVLCGLQFKKDENYFKIYLGAGRHKKHNKYTIKSQKSGDPASPVYFDYSPPRIVEDSYSEPSIHLGLEAGHRF